MQSKRNAQKEAQANTENSAFLAAEEAAAAQAAAAPEAPEAPAAPAADKMPIKESLDVKKPLIFSPVDTGDFEVVDFKSAGETLTARFIGLEKIEGFTATDGSLKDMLVFRSYPDNEKKVVNPSYALEKMFVYQTSDSSIQWEKNPIFQITFLEDVALAGGHKVKKFKFSVAYEG